MRLEWRRVTDRISVCFETMTLTTRQPDIGHNFDDLIRHTLDGEAYWTVGGFRHHDPLVETKIELMYLTWITERMLLE